MNIQEMLASDRFFVSGHRGYMAKYPQNTMISFQKAIEAGVDMIELDVRLSKDNVLMLLHDNTLDNTTDGSGPLEDCTALELSRLDAGIKTSPEFAGERIPTFQALCEFLADYPQMMVNVEVKPAPRALQAAEQVVAMTERYHLTERCIFNSFDGDVIALFHDRYGLPTQAYPGERMLHFVDGETGTYSKMTAMGFHIRWITPQRIKQCTDMGIQPWCWSPNTEEQAHFVLDHGLKVATCDDPLPMLQVARERGRR
ncbi:glycerophosphodiester phosphodiesterase [Ruminococcaceae bacterium OttesenSCG-928-L11]|nr:glycerophosphodiester phosphodiesterase [Ruminococcaceae bacterium OttesenSCG-928-L11]